MAVGNSGPPLWDRDGLDLKGAQSWVDRVNLDSEAQQVLFSAQALREVQYRSFLEQVSKQESPLVQMVWAMFFALLALGASAVANIYIFQMRVAKPLGEVSQYAEDVAAGEDPEPLKLKYRDELAVMFASLQRMKGTLFSRIRELKEAERRARKSKQQAVLARAQALSSLELAQRASHVQEDFLRRMSHEIRTPLNAIIGMSYLSLQAGLSGVQRDYLSQINKSGSLLLDMGHMGRKPILAAWGIVLLALVASYMGQTSFLIRNPGAENVLFELINSQAHYLYVPFLVLSLMATVIASQALISGLFSIMYQSMATHIMPLFKVDYTSKELHSQIYINSVNWALFVAVVLVICGFGESHKLAAAYGLAVTGTMCYSPLLNVSRRIPNCARRLASSTRSPILSTIPPSMSLSTAKVSSISVPAFCCKVSLSLDFLSAESCTAVMHWPRMIPLASSSSLPYHAAISLKKASLSLSASRKQKLRMDNVGTHVLYLGLSKPVFRKATYTQFLTLQDEYNAQREREARALKDDLDRKMAFVERFRAKATKARQAGSRMKMAKKLEKELEDYRPEPKRKELNFSWPEAPHSEKIVLSAADLEFHFGDGKTMSAECVHRDFRAGDVRHSLADISRAEKLLGYGPQFDVRQGLRLAGDWYAANL